LFCLDSKTQIDKKISDKKQLAIVEPWLNRTWPIFRTLKMIEKTRSNSKI